jgi:ATP-dependent Clp protease ATP-binding subunit ClpC
MVIESVLLDYGVDLTAAAREGKLDKVWGRDEEVARVSEVLIRRKKNNVLLLGDPGVGKTSIAEHLAQKIINKEVSWALHDKVIFSLNMTAVMAGTQYRGQMEKRLKQIIDYLEVNPQIILFIDEIHSIVESNSSSSGMSVSNILKPALSSGKIQCIGATTSDEARKHFDKDAAFSRRFQKVTIDQPSPEDTIKILMSCKGVYEAHHGVLYPDELIAKIPYLATKFIRDRFLPDSAIDILDETGAKAQIASSKVPIKIVRMETELAKLNEKKITLIKKERYNETAALKKEYDALRTLLDEEIAKANETRTVNQKTITEKDVLQVVSALSKIPLDKLSEEGVDKLELLQKTLDARVIGQDTAKQQIVKAFRRDLAGFGSTVPSYLFMGKSGVGKTEIAKVVADAWFNGNLIRVDMSEFMEKHNASMMVGSPPGYVGHENGGKLTEQVRKNPHSLVLLDEIEKAHPDVSNLLLQIFDEGFITDSQGKRVDFSNTMIIMTSNLGTKETIDSNGIGFGSVKRNVQSEKSIGAAKKHFSPELWNRIGEVVVFEELSETDIDKILDIQLVKVREVLAKKNIKLKVNKKVKEFLSKKGYDPKYGGRFLKKAVKTYLIDPLAEYVMGNPDLKDTKLVAALSKEETITIREDAPVVPVEAK